MQGILRDMWTPTKRYQIDLAIVWRVTESEENLEAARQLRIYFNISDMQCWLKGRDRWRKKKNKEFGSHKMFSGPKSQKAVILFRKSKVLRGFEKMYILLIQRQSHIHHKQLRIIFRATYWAPHNNLALNGP